ncbi:MAG: hypothetical protein OEZ54_07140 [Gemmatimonadota bacterium]|nr:hypothetical protein [Gemmatimonadota bacterium]
MSRTKRPWGVVAAPIVLVAGLVVITGVRTAEGWKEEVERWGYELQHTDHTVRMEMPVYVPMFLAGDWVGELETVIVERLEPGAIDKVTVHATAGDDWDGSQWEGCAVELRVLSDHSNNFKNVFRCIQDTSDMIEFGSIFMDGNGPGEIPIFVRIGGLPCEENLGVELTPCAKVRSDITTEMREMAEQIRSEAERIRDEARAIRTQVRNEIRQSNRN